MLVVDATQNLGGWEHKTSARIYRSMKLRKVRVEGDGVLKPTSPETLAPLLESHTFNCLLIGGQGPGPDVEDSASLHAYLDTVLDNPSVQLLALWTCGSPAPRIEEELTTVVVSKPILLYSESDLGAHEAFVFFSRFFEELALHCPDDISAPMARFSYLKTRHFANGKMELST